LEAADDGFESFNYILELWNGEGTWMLACAPLYIWMVVDVEMQSGHGA
jgi:hypothetical protein